MDKLNYMKSWTTRFRDYGRIQRSYRQAEFKDAYLNNPKGLKFKNDFNLLAHMHDLRMWTLAYGPSTMNNLQRMQETHMIGNEVWYQIHQALWRRVLLWIVGYFLVTKVFKNKFKQGNQDYVDTQYRDSTATM